MRLVKFQNWKRCGIIVIVAMIPVCLLLADRMFPLPLPGQEHFARVVTDRHGVPLRSFADADGVWRYSIELEDVSPLYLQALLNYEDRWFYYHPGVNPLAMLRATWQNLVNRRGVSGGSTLTMQVARLLDPHSKTLAGKLKQCARAFQLEWHLSKRDILELYLNLAPFGGNLEGVAAASHSYLGKAPLQLSHAEAALLAVLPQAPSRYRPDRYPERARAARDKVLQRMADFAVWDEQITDEAKQESVYAYSPERPLIAPLLAERLVRHHPDQQVIETFIDRDLQLWLQEFLSQRIGSYPEHSSAAAMVVDNRNGEVVAYAGTADYGSRQRAGFVDMATAVRSPGSTLKPFLYGLAIEDGLIHAQSLLADVPRLFSDYRPENFYQSFSGPVTATNALQRSLNLPAVQVLEQYGPRKLAAALNNAGAGLEFPGVARPNLAMILGGVGTSLENLVQLYTALGNQGMSQRLRYTPSDEKQSRYLLSSGAAWITFQMLATNPSDDFTYDPKLSGGTWLAWKTGTSYGFRDAWSVAATRDYSIGVWVGRPDGTAMPGHYGAVSATPLLFSIVKAVSGHNTPPPDRPHSVTENEVCWPLGEMVTADNKRFCERRYQSWLLDKTAPPTLSDARIERLPLNPLPLRIDPSTGLQLQPSCQPEQATSRMVALWPAQLDPWLRPEQRRSARIPDFHPQCAPPPGAVAQLTINGLDEGNRYQRVNEQVPAVIHLQSLGGQGKRHWFINGELKYSRNADALIQHPLVEKGQVQILVMDDAGGVDQVKIFSL